ncbi:MAG: hypothetical protein ACQCN4_03885 [Candidatus Bathyarchaeia archaeon]|jgi:hypothetical protein
MKKSKLLTLILVSVILLQLLFYTNLAGVDARPFHFPSHSCCRYCILDYVQISPETATISAGQWQTFTLTAYGKFGNSWDISHYPPVVWSIDSGDGTYVWAGNSVQVTKAGTWTITATYGCKTATASLTVTPATAQSELDYLVISPTLATIAAGSSQSYSATATDLFGNSWDVTNEISALNGWGIALEAGGTWNGAVYTSEKAGVWMVTATYLTKTATATLNVTTGVSPSNLAYITASVSPNSISAPETTTGTATAYDTFGNSWDISTLASWSILEEGDGGSWTNNIYTSQNAGVYTVQASYGGKTATTSLSVTHSTNPAYLDHISIAPKESTVNAGVSQAYTAMAYDTFGNSWSVIADYSSQSSNIAVSGNSVYSNVSGVYTITGTYSGKSDTAKLNVVGHLPTIVTLSVSPKTAMIPAGSAVSYAAIASDGYNTWDVTSIVTWSIDAEAGGSWNQNTGEYTTANAGTWTIKAALEKLSDTAALTVTANPELLSYIVVSPKSVAVAAGGSQSFTVAAYDQFGNSLGDVTASTRFSVPGASVSGNSVAANVVGDYHVTATYSGLTDTSNLQVTGYTVKFIQNGLQSGTSWSIRFGGQLYSSSTDTITINNVSALSYSWSTQNPIVNGQTRYSTSQTSGNIAVSGPLTQHIEYLKQYLVSYQATGSALSVSVPSPEWVNSGGAASGVFPEQIINEAQDTRCSFVGDDRPKTITQPTVITGDYLTQYKVTFQQTGLLSDAKGTVLTVAGVPKEYSDFPIIQWVDEGTQLAFSFEISVASTTTDTVYALTDTNVVSPIVIDEPTLIQGNYAPQISTSLSLVLIFVLLATILTALLMLGYRRRKMKTEQEIDAAANKF